MSQLNFFEDFIKNLFSVVVFLLTNDLKLKYKMSDEKLLKLTIEGKSKRILSKTKHFS